MSRYDGLIIPRSYSEYLNKTDSATLSQMLQQLTGLWSHAVSAGDNKPVTSDAVYEALTDEATIQQALQLPGVLSGAVAAGDNKAITSNAVNLALLNYNYVYVYTTSTTDFNNTFNLHNGVYEIFIIDTLDASKWIKLIYSTNGVNYQLVTVINQTLEVKAANQLGTIILQGGSGNYKAFATFYGF